MPIYDLETMILDIIGEKPASAGTISRMTNYSTSHVLMKLRRMENWGQVKPVTTKKVIYWFAPKCGGETIKEPRQTTTKLYTNTSLDDNSKQVYERWTVSLLEKQYENEKECVSRNLIVEEMREQELSPNKILAYEKCHTLTRKKLCPNCDKTYYFPFSCNDRICPICSKNRIMRVVKRYRKPIMQMKNPKLISVTIGHIPLDRPETISHWRKKFYVLIRRIDEKIESGFCVLEISSKGNLHFHAIIDTPYYLPQASLSDIWFKISGRYIVDIRRANPKIAMGYLLKYVVKAPEFKDAHSYVSYAKITKGRRLLTTYGKLYNIGSMKQYELYCSYCVDKMIVSWEGYYIEHDFMIETFGSMKNVP